MSDELIKSLNSELSRLKAEAKERRIKGKRSAEELEQLRKQVAELTAERDGLRTRLEASPGEQAAKIADLEKQIKVRDVRDRFGPVASQLADKVTLEHLFKLNDFDPAAVDLAALDVDGLVKGWRDAFPSVFKAAETATPAAGAATRQALQVQVPTGRGAPDTTSQFRVRRSDISDPDWMHRNQARLTAEYAAGNVVVTD